MACSENTVYLLPLDTDAQVGGCSVTRGQVQAPTPGVIQPVTFLSQRMEQ